MRITATGMTGSFGISPSYYSNYQNLLSSSRRISSGERITRASDDPAGLIISEQLRGNIAELNQRLENTSLAIDKFQTADATIMQLRDTLVELRSNAMGAVNGANDEDVQAAYHNAATAAVSAYNEMIADASFGSGNLLDGSAGSVADISTLSGVDLSTPEKALESFDRINAAAGQLDKIQSHIGATVKYDLEGQRAALQVERQNLIAAESSIRDTDLAQEISSFVSFGALQHGALALARAHGAINSQLVLGILDSLRPK